jgi:hypothetical protein
MTVKVILRNIIISGFALIATGAFQNAAADTSQSKKVAKNFAKAPSRIKLGNTVNEMVVEASEKTIVFKKDSVGASIFSGECLEVDVQGALKHIKFTPSFEGMGEGVANVWMRIAEGDKADSVCQTGECFGNFEITSNQSGTLYGANPRKALASPKAIKLLNSSNFALCLGVKAPVAGAVTASFLPVRDCFEPTPCSKPPINIAGYWKSNYRCDDSCEGLQKQDSLRVFISQDPKDLTKASYVDNEGGSYKGTVCGNEFTFVGGGEDWSESGSFTFKDADSATKTSNYSNHKTCCVGRCSDSLVKEKEPKKS